MMRFISNWRFWIGIVISVVSLWLAVRDVPFSEFREQLEQANYLWIIPGIICIILTTIVRGQRWKVLLNNLVPLPDTFWAFSVGNLFNNVLPLRAGDLIRVIVLTDKNKLPAAYLATSVVVERLMDIVTILLLLVTILPFMEIPQFAVQAGLIFGVAVCSSLAILLFLVRYQQFSQRLLIRILNYLPFLPENLILKLWQDVVAGLYPLTKIRIALSVTLYSLLGWLLSVGFYMCVLISFGSRSPLIEGIFVVVVVSLAISLPSSPGFIGVFHLAGQQALIQPFGNAYNESTAFGVILVAYITFYIVSSTTGGIGLLYFGKRFYSLTQRVVESTDAESPQSVSI